MTIETSAEWWRTVEQNWDELLGLFEGSEPSDQRDALERMKRQRDARIARRLVSARRRAPHHCAGRGDRAWRVLFDLCAEQWVLHQAVA